MTTRSRQVILRLDRGGANDGPQTVIRLTEEEAADITEAADAAGTKLAPWARAVVSAAAGGEGHGAAVEAAAATGLPVSTWVREVLLAASGRSPLGAQLARAREHHRTLA